jgi:RelA/SpoT family (p)ppGpp synthetase
LEALLDKADKISTIEEAERVLFSHIDPNSAPIKKALKISKNAHKGQFRKSGVPYVVHPIIVAILTAIISNDETMIVAALLHDVVEDSDFTIEELGEIFGKDVALLVEGLTKIDVIRDEKLIPSHSNKKLISSALTFRKMLLTSIKDVRVLVVKLCDRLHNMMTLNALSENKQIRISEETMVVYAPIAHRLGIGHIKSRLEDYSFYYIYPNAYREIDNYIKGHAQSLQLKLNTFIQKIKRLMILNGFKEKDFDIFGRVKHYYSMYQKMQRKGIGIDEVLDLIAIRILVKEDIDCYKVLGLLHINYKPIISRFKDYVTLPKENGYSTIHTTLFDDVGIVETQIRTYDMHRTAEFGIAAHWHYKAGGRDKYSVNLNWLESLQYQDDNIEEFFALAKGDLFSDDISVFSPAGDNYTLPRDAVALDFAYAIHSDIGNRASSALINKRKALLLTPLKNGDIVRIITDTESNIRCSWIDTVKTSRAKEGIKNACKQRIKKCNSLSAINIFALVFDKPTDRVKEMFNICESKENAFKLTSNKQIYHEVLKKFIVNYKEELNSDFIYPKEFIKEHFKFISNKPIKNIEFDYCCHPKIGDNIVAFYKNGGVNIHHKLCKEAYKKMKNHQPMVFISWVSSKSYRYRLIISLQNRKGILADLLQKLAFMDLNVLSIQLGITSSESAEFCKIEIETKEHHSRKLKDKLSKKFKLIDMISLNDAYNNKIN